MPSEHPFLPDSSSLAPSPAPYPLVFLMGGRENVREVFVLQLFGTIGELLYTLLYGLLEEF